MKPIFYIVAIISVIVSGSALALISYYGNALHNDPKFKAKTDLYMESVSSQNTFPIPCTNLTLGNQTKEFTGTTYIASTCPTTDNQCSEFVCKIDGYCELRTKSTSSCYQSAQCGNFSRCDLDTCECVTYEQVCTIDSDCGIEEGNPCVEITCVSGQCITNLTAGAECSDTPGCQDGYSCNSNCTCEIIQSSIVIVEYTPTFSADPSYSQPFNLPFDSINDVLYTDLDTYARVDLSIDASSNTSVTTGNQFGFLFSLPVDADVTANVTGIFSVGQINNINVNTSFYGSGYLSLFSSTLGLALASNNNYAYIGPNDGGQFEIALYITYKKL